jgi:hypothetical protein
MKELLTWSLITGILFVLCITLTIVGIVRRKMLPVYIALFILFLSGISAIRLGYIAVTKGYGRIVAAIKPRTGAEIYAALFGNPGNSCLRVTRFQDQIVPRTDAAIWLQFDTCPAELSRVLSRKTYSASRQSTAGWNTEGPLANENWFRPESLGDSVLVFQHLERGSGDHQTLYSNLDSTRAFYVDVAD